ncbi:MAG: DUF192 domain-containing protein [Alphaproteobacteria bacterium]|nr:DUF192 domain-containing protein [Alphaproteobacteria bacterium]MBL6940374.1 DUF192 domain-containing protein [Alphaproteobacteria bacterium]MBL7099095.1 DUF192 domain-containing protein [Alphaproteobacteria bacterium]
MRAVGVLFVGLLLALSPAAAVGAKPLPAENIVIDTAKGPRAFRVEVAADDASRERGLMQRAHLAANGGMLFDFRKQVMTAFWMKDTPLSLDILFVRADGTISTIAANAVPFSTAEIVSAEPIRAVIEINGGLARKLGIVPGDRVRASIFADANTH